jgi:acyl-CoA reductase LuxC
MPVAEYAIDRLFEALDAGDLQAAIERELGSLGVLDGFESRPGVPRERALPAGRVCVISSRTTIGVALFPAVFALLAKCDVVVKDREDTLIGAFFSTLAEELDEFRFAAVAEQWEGKARERRLAEFDVVVAFGDDATIASIASTLTPRTRLIPFGTRASIGYVAREALATPKDAEEIARGAARDLVLYDTEGCLSLHALFVEAGGEIAPEAFAERLARAVERANVEFPVSERSPQTVASLAAARDLAAFREAEGRGGAHSDAAATFLIDATATHGEPPSFLPRALGVRTVSRPADAVTYCKQHRLPVEAVAVAGDRDDLTAMAVATGAARIARFGELQSPLSSGRHGGRPRIAEFVRWITDER